MVAPILKNICNDSQVAAPMRIYLAKSSLIFAESHIIRRIVTVKIDNNIIIPINPASSPNIAKIESVFASGK